MAGTAHQLRFVLRRDRVRLTAWAGSLAVFCAYYVVATAAVYPTAEDRQNRAASLAGPGGALLSGPGYGLDDYSVGAMFANEMTLWLMVLLAAMNILQITRSTRAEEEAGRTELVRALPVGRHAVSVAAFVAVVIADAVFALAASALLIGVGQLAVVDTLAMVAGVAATALVFAALTTVTCQLTVHGRGASGLAFAALIAAVLVRGIGDLRAQHGGWLSWLSPIAWTHQTRAHVDLRLWPLGLAVVATALGLVLGALLASRRDLGSGLLPERPGRADAAPSLATPFALALRQQRTTLAWWLVGCLVVFGASGLFLAQGTVDALEEIAAQNDLTATIFGDDALAAFLAIVVLHSALAVAVFAIGAVLRIRPEEDEGRLGLGLSRPVSRTSTVLSHVAVAALGSCLLLVVGGALALWTGARLAGADVDLGALLASAGAYALAVGVIITASAALYAWVPRATPLAWVLLAVIVVESFFGTLLQLPDAVRALSPFWWVGDQPAEGIETSHMIGLGTAAAALLVLTVIGFRRRDLAAG